MAKVIGIDLGTTYSCVAVADREGPRVLPNKTGQPTMPSVVATTDSGKRLVGQLAKRQAITNPINTVYGAKRLIGRRWSSPDVQKAVGLVSYQCSPGPHDDVRVVMAGKQYAVPEISSMVLHEMRLVAERALGEPVTQAVVTVPAYFNDNQRQATKDAGKIAGLDILRIINEPTAAALAYGFGKGLEQKVAIYDLGGGTFDISVLEIGLGVFEVLATAGDTFLGGEDFDERIIQWLVEDFATAHGVDLRHDKMALQRLRDAAERAKIELSAALETEINLPFIYSSGKGNAVHLQKKLSRTTFNSLVADLVQRTVDISSEALAAANLKTTDVAAVILVGGMTRVTLVQEQVQRLFGRPPSKGVHPDEVVACGAAIQGLLLSQGSDETLLLDVTPHDLGIMVAGGLFDVLIGKDTTIPTTAKKIFTTVRDGQTQVRILVLQGVGAHAKDNELLGEFLLDGLRHAGRGEVHIEVTFEIGADGIVSVDARDVETGRQQTIRLTASSGLTDAEVAAMTEENHQVGLIVAASDAFEAGRVDVERVLRELDTLIPDAKPLLDGTDVGVTALQKATDIIGRARDAIAGRNAPQLLASKDALERTAHYLRSVVQGGVQGGVQKK